MCGDKLCPKCINILYFYLYLIFVFVYTFFVCIFAVPPCSQEGVMLTCGVTPSFDLSVFPDEPQAMCRGRRHIQDPVFFLFSP